MQIGVIHYTNIHISDSSTMLKGRLQFHQELLHFDLLDSDTLTEDEIRTHHGRILQSIQKEDYLLPIHSGIDLTHFFMLEYQLPITLHDTGSLYLPLQKKGNALYDQTKEIASPFCMDQTTSTSEATVHAIQCFFFSHASTTHTYSELLEAAGTMFTHVHGGTFKIELL
ncbi:MULTISPECIES: hypothetical protein [Bacillaceae]|uniref:Uncharacterized protein n=2 Tax=Bacillaceae TaxID=186817 RepID=A0A9D5DNZ6_9BACI|nr:MULTISPECIES: hypothetical protein [Bacillaceae]KQL55820.1 hypothetical protein AN965_16145 [Alkalicoccobacillus plakortidis]MBG9785482.1 hypothetical protein [Shouchella lehensis]RQW19732.1 hypothetical protein EH196_06165 [Bacillus sp. C1-1]TES47919.1 hypothetical protein E2L03_12315 [Shouchella lehensis]